MKKNCLLCGKEFAKPSSCSLKNWTEKRKYCSKSCADKDRLGKCFWTQKTRQHMSKKNSGPSNPFFGKTFSKATKAKILRSRAETIRERGKEIYTTVALANTGPKSHKWKGELAGVRSKHLWIERQIGKASEGRCDDCGATSETARLEWSNKDHTYRRILSDWTIRCKKCHAKYDIKHNGYRQAVYH